MITRPASLLGTLVDPVTLGLLLGFGMLAVAYPFLILKLAHVLLTHKP